MINDAALELIKRHEGLRLTAYKCPAGVWTLGYGHTRYVRQGQQCTETQAEVWLMDDLRESGAVNMFGAAPYLSTVFDISAHQAQLVLVDWMTHYG